MFIFQMYKIIDSLIVERYKIEKWCNLIMDSIIFDLDIHNWKQNESEFDKLISNKRNLLFLIESDDGIKFGVFISSQIYVGKWISDENAFVFTFKDNKPMKFDIKKNVNEKKSIILFV